MQYLNSWHKLRVSHSAYRLQLECSTVAGHSSMQVLLWQPSCIIPGAHRSIICMPCQPSVCYGLQVYYPRWMFGEFEASTVAAGGGFVMPETSVPPLAVQSLQVLHAAHRPA